MIDKKAFRKRLLLRGIPIVVLMIAAALTAWLGGPVWLTIAFSALLAACLIWALLFVLKTNRDTGSFWDILKIQLRQPETPVVPEDFYDTPYRNGVNAESVRFHADNIAVSCENASDISHGWDNLLRLEVVFIDDAAILPQIQLTFDGNISHYIYFDMDTCRFLKQKSQLEVHHLDQLIEIARTHS